MLFLIIQFFAGRLSQQEGVVGSKEGYFPKPPYYSSHKIFTKIENKFILKKYSKKIYFSTLNKLNITSILK